MENFNRPRNRPCEKPITMIEMKAEGREEGGLTGTKVSIRAWTDRGTCVPLPFHVTSGQPTMGQGVVVHPRERTLLRKADNRRGETSSMRFAEHCY
ncbi:unnamed protein product [Spirodela intermedia]|uniref:Uncharacterized protein n=1 Tax=Spirodela intermedia TaxID=51605 RepID=A0ABN7EA69_SPIIN|nr:unnamed protein product [Spirodela intermedia]